MRAIFHMFRKLEAILDQQVDRNSSCDRCENELLKNSDFPIGVWYFFLKDDVGRNIDFGNIWAFLNHLGAEIEARTASKAKFLPETTRPNNT